MTAGYGVFGICIEKAVYKSHSPRKPDVRKYAESRGFFKKNNRIHEAPRRLFP
jgi:hypothetical protein